MIEYILYSILKYILYKNTIKILIIKTIINIIALTICKYTLPKNFINNNFKTFLLILVLIKTIFIPQVFAYELRVLSKSTNIEEIELSRLAKLMISGMDANSFVIMYIIVFINYMILTFILGYIMRYFYPNVENNYKIFSIPLVIFG